MGSLIGHVGPGLAFFLLGFWHLYNHLKLFAINGHRRYRSSPWFPITFKGKNSLLRPLELYIIMFATGIALIMELFISPHRHHPLDADGTIPTNHLHTFEHASMFLTFFVYAALALLLDRPERPIPAQNDVVMFIGAIAFAQELLMFHLHSTDHTGVEGQYHWLLRLVTLVTVATTLLGIRHDKSFNVAFVRSLSAILQGVWFMVMGFALWTPSLIPKGCFMHDEDGHTVVRCDGEMSLHRAKALVNIGFSWCLIVLAIFATWFYVFMMKIYGGDKNEQEYALMLSNSSPSGDEEDEGDVEAQHKFGESKLSG